MKRVLEDLQHEKAISDAKAARTVELEEQSRQLQQSNHNLELRLSSLCETPFIKEAFMRRDTLTKLEAAVQQADDYKVRVAHLQEAVKTHFSALNSLKEQLTKTQEDKDAVMKRAEELTVSQAQLLNSRQAVVEENERLESLLKLQSDISKQLHHDLERAVAEKEATIQETIELQRRLQESEDASITQSAQIRVLERATDHLRRQVREQIKDHSTVQSYQYEKNDFNVIQQQQSHKFHLELLSELLQGRRVEDLKRCENMLEIWVKSAVIESDIIAFDASTFVVIDFCTFESQSTTPVSGMNPCWDFGVTYKLTIDDFFLRFLAVDSITLELNIVSNRI